MTRKFLGIDFGSKRIGLALSDENGILAFPFKVILNKSNLFSDLEKILQKEKIDQIVIGDSLNLENKSNLINKEIEIFISILEKKYKIPIYRQKEFFTSMHAQETKGKKIKNARQVKFSKNQTLDAQAAALILQRYLDLLNNKRKE